MAAAFVASLVLPPLFPHATSTAERTTAAVRDPRARFMNTSFLVGAERVNPELPLDQHFQVPEVAPPHAAEERSGRRRTHAAAHPGRELQVPFPREGRLAPVRR